MLVCTNETEYKYSLGKAGCEGTGQELFKSPLRRRTFLPDTGTARRRTFRSFKWQMKLFRVITWLLREQQDYYRRRDIISIKFLIEGNDNRRAEREIIWNELIHFREYN